MDFMNWGALASGGDPSVDYGMDAAPTGAGGDPYGSSDMQGGDAEQYTTGMMPGGADGQLSPFSPGGGWDFTDVLSGIGRAAVGAWGNVYRRAGALPNAGALAAGGNPMVPYAGGGGAAAVRGPPVYAGGTPAFDESGHGARPAIGAIVRAIREQTGMRVTARSLTNLIVRYGFDATARMTGASQEQLLTLFLWAKGVRHHRRGPGLYTIARKLRAAARLQGTVSRILGRGGRARHRHYAAAPFRRRHRRHRRR